MAILTGLYDRCKLWLNYIFRLFTGFFMAVKAPEPKGDVKMTSTVQTSIRPRLEQEADSRPFWMKAEWLEPRLVVVTLAALVIGSLLERAEAAGWLVAVFAVTAYIVRRLFATLPVMAVVTLFVFFLLRFAPGEGMERR